MATINDLSLLTSFIKVHRSGKELNPYLESMSHTLKPAYTNPRAHCSARVRHDELLLRTEEFINIRGGRSWQEVGKHYTTICPHLRCSYKDDVLSRTIQCQLSHRGDRECSCDGLRQCLFCPTEFAVDTRNARWPSKKLTVHITAWRNFGACKTPLDPKWQAQVESGFSRRDKSKTSFIFIPGSIRNAFDYEVNY